MQLSMLLVHASRLLAAAVTARGLALWAHELSHLAIARLLGYPCSNIDLKGARPSVTVGGQPSAQHADLIRNTGWAFSVCLAMLSLLLLISRHEISAGHEPLASGGLDELMLIAAVAMGCTYTACEAVQSDLLSSDRPLNRFFCGNFGMLLLAQGGAAKVKYYLRRMVKVTMMRGAQSAGIVTYRRTGNGKNAIFHGARYRVVNGKRTDLSEKVIHKARSIVRPSAIKAPAIFQGHTRFATSSIADLDGCHPHQWTSKVRQRHWYDDVEQAEVTGSGVAICSRVKNVEAYITHNGDLDFFEVHGTVYSLGDIQTVRGYPSFRRALAPRASGKRRAVQESGAHA